MLESSDLARRLDGVVSEDFLLEHPFYQAWAEGRLDRADLAFYSTQYWRQVEAFPGHLEALSLRLPEGDARHIVAENLADERDGDHPGLWRTFAGALDAADLDETQPEPETRACVDSFRYAMEDAPPAYALGMLYGYESQTPAVAESKIRGLREHYGFEGDGLAYFELHAELDVTHSEQLASALAELVTEQESLDEAVEGARSGARAIWGLLDGVARVRAIT